MVSYARSQTPKKATMKYLASATVTATAFIVLLSNTANAGIILSNMNGDLVLDIKNPIRFEVNYANTTRRIGFSIYGAVRHAGTAGLNPIFSPGSTPFLIGSGLPPTNPSFGGLGVQRLRVSYILPHDVSLDARDRVTLTPGSIRFRRFFNQQLIYGLNYTCATEATLVNSNGTFLSAPTLTRSCVPEPNSLAIFGAISLIAAVPRRRRTA